MPSTESRPVSHSTDICDCYLLDSRNWLARPSEMIWQLQKGNMREELEETHAAGRDPVSKSFDLLLATNTCHRKTIESGRMLVQWWPALAHHQTTFNFFPWAMLIHHGAWKQKLKWCRQVWPRARQEQLPNLWVHTCVGHVRDSQHRHYFPGSTVAISEVMKVLCSPSSHSESNSRI